MYSTGIIRVYITANVASACLNCETKSQELFCGDCVAVAYFYCVPGFRPSEVADQRKAFGSLHLKCHACDSLEVEATPITPSVPVKRATALISAPAKRTRLEESATVLSISWFSIESHCILLVIACGGNENTNEETDLLPG